MYQWRSGVKRSVSADVAGSVCEELEHGAGLTPTNLVRASTPEDAPLHGEFEWDNDLAADAYRKVQAGGIIRQLVKVVANVDEPVRAFVSVAKRTDEETRSYIGVEAAIADPILRGGLLAEAYRDASAFARKYRHLAELASVIQVIDKLPSFDD